MEYAKNGKIDMPRWSKHGMRLCGRSL